jgi:hypothetical protein
MAEILFNQVSECLLLDDSQDYSNLSDNPNPPKPKREMRGKFMERGHK